MKYCISCGVQIAAERLAIVPSTKHCSVCVQAHDVKRYKGALNFLHKTGGSIMVMEADFYDKEWKKYNPSFGRGSGIHKMSPRMAGTA